jgi:lysophospholipase L1-like esterase
MIAHLQLIIGIFGLLAGSFRGQNGQPVTVYMIGDSTMADKPLEGNPERGWGQAFPLFFDHRVKVSNHAMNGRSSKSFVDEGRWAAVLSQLKQGDYVLIQFGHNDEKQEDPARYTDAQSTFRQNLERFIKETRGKGATPILLTPVMRRRFDKDGNFYDTHGKYPDAVREVAHAQKVVLIDLHSLTEELIVGLGEEGSKKLFLWISPGQYLACPDGRQDDTHFSEFGATQVARLAADEIRRQEIPLKQYLMESPGTAQALSSGSRYLFAYFTGNGQDGLHLAYSEDGLKWQELIGYRSRIVPQVGTDKLMRDPFIREGPDGLFHMVWTVSWKEKGIGYAFSKDLMTWSEQKYLPVMEHEPAARNCWAPEMVYDDENAQYLIFWATTIPGRFPRTDGQNSKGPGDPGLNHRLYYVFSKDMQAFSNTRLFFDQGFNVIDATIVKDGAKYLMFLKDETNAPLVPEKNIRWTSADHAEGPYSPVSGAITGKYWCEGPSAIKIGEDWVVYFDRYRENRYGAVVSKDLKTWRDISDQVQFPAGARHGTVFRVAKPAWTRLMELR